MDVLTAKIGANMAISELTESGQVGYVTPPAFEKVFECIIPADGSTVSIAGPFTFKGENYERFVTVTVDGESYDCYVRLFNQGDDAEIEPVTGSMPCKITGVCNGKYTSVYAMVENLKVRYKTAHDADGHVIVGQLGQPTIHTIDPKYLPSTVPNIQTAEVGQAIVVKAVDENGKPTEWEATSVGGGSGDSTLYIELMTSAGNYVNPGLDALYQAIMERKPVNAVFMYDGGFTNHWEWRSDTGILKVGFVSYSPVYCNKRADGTWNHNSP
jgi:hypothetical protein